MFRAHCQVFAGLAFLLAFGASTAHAAHTPIADPGFSFVDMDQDGLYTPETDIGLKSTRSVDIDSLILNDGNFNTQLSEGAYHAPCSNVSLVIPASVKLNSAKPLNLKAGLHIIVHGTLTASSICLQACANLDMTKANCNFVSQLNAHAGCSATLDGMTASGDPNTGQICVQACQNVSSNPTPDGWDTAFLAGTCIGVQAGCSLSMNSAFLAADGPNAYVYASGGSAATISNSSFAASGGTIAAGSCSGSAKLLNDDWAGACLYASTGCDLNVTDSNFASTGSITLHACGKVTGNSTSTVFSGASLCVTGSGGIDMSKSALVTLGGSTSMVSDCGPVHIDGATVTADTGLNLHARTNIGISGANIHANHFYTLLSDCGSIDASNSIIPPFAATAADTAISLTAPGSISAAGAHWSVPANMSIQSSCSTVDVGGASLMTTGSASKILISAGGGMIDATTASFSPAPQFGPAGVHVIGYAH